MSSIEGVEGSVARPMNSEQAQILCDPNRIRLTGAAVFVISVFLASVFLTDGNRCIIPPSVSRLLIELG